MENFVPVRIGAGLYDAYSLLSAMPYGERVVAVARAGLAQINSIGESSRYIGALEKAIIEEPPPFGTLGYAEVYSGASQDGQWLAISLISNAEREGDGAKRLWSLAACSVNSKEQQQLKRHAVDESRHALAYLALLDLTFPEATSPKFRRELNELSPCYSMEQSLFAVEGSPYAKQPTIDDFVQMNIAEIRTALHHLMQRPALEQHCRPENRSQAKSIQQSLLKDELYHVAYTAVLIEQRAQTLGLDIVGLFAKRFHDFNIITMEELGDKQFDCSVSCCAKRPWCRAKASPAQSADS
jgi:hypothetical protein